MTLFLWVAFGALGTLTRYGLQGLVQFRAGEDFPYGTLAVNLLGCFLLGYFGQYSLQRLALPPEWRMGIAVGFFGAFTTFSTFGLETVRLMDDGEWLRAAVYVLGSVVGGLALCFVGVRLGNAL